MGSYGVFVEIIVFKEGQKEKDIVGVICLVLSFRFFFFLDNKEKEKDSKGIRFVYVVFIILR